MYSITSWTRKQAKRLGLTVKPSRKEGKKIDVMRDGYEIASIGYKGMGDFGTYRESKGKEYADERRRLYHLRHKDGPVDSPAFLAKRLLW